MSIFRARHVLILAACALAGSAAAAEALLKKAEAGVALNQRRPPAGFDADAFKARVVSAIESLAPGR